MNVTELEQRIGCLDPEWATPAEMAAARNDVAVLGEIHRRLRTLVDERTIAWMDNHPDEELTNGDNVRWYVGIDRTWKPDDPVKVIGSLLEACGGDVGQFATCLSASAFKYGACRDALGDAFTSLFTEHVSREVKTGKPRRVVKVTNPEYADAGKGDE